MQKQDLNKTSRKQHNDDDKKKRQRIKMPKDILSPDEESDIIKMILEEDYNQELAIRLLNIHYEQKKENDHENKN